VGAYGHVLSHHTLNGTTSQGTDSSGACTVKPQARLSGAQVRFEPGY
jgi:hypothetical protein